MMTESEKQMERIARRLLESIEQLLEDGKLELKDYKTVTGTLKELRELSRSEERAAPEQGLTVRFVGAAEEYSR